MAQVRAHVVVEGRVQGVRFRSGAKHAARSVGVTGWVKNLSDGRVEAVFEGDEEAVERAIAWCRRGPPSARVSNVTVERELYTGQFPDFSAINNFLVWGFCKTLFRNWLKT